MKGVSEISGVKVEREDFPGQDFLSTALSLLKFPYIQGDQLAILSDCAGEEADIKVKIVDSSYEDYLDMCGGMPQVLGKSLIETDLGAKFELELEEPPLKSSLRPTLDLFRWKFTTREDESRGSLRE